MHLERPFDPSSTPGEPTKQVDQQELLQQLTLAASIPGLENQVHTLQREIDKIRREERLNNHPELLPALLTTKDHTRWKKILPTSYQGSHLNEYPKVIPYKVLEMIKNCNTENLFEHYEIRSLMLDTEDKTITLSILLGHSNGRTWKLGKWSHTPHNTLPTLDELEHCVEQLNNITISKEVSFLIVWITFISLIIWDFENFKHLPTEHWIPEFIPREQYESRLLLFIVMITVSVAVTMGSFFYLYQRQSKSRLHRRYPTSASILGVQ